MVSLSSDSIVRDATAIIAAFEIDLMPAIGVGPVGLATL